MNTDTHGSPTADQLFRTMQKEAARYDVLQDVLRELDWRGVKDPMALATIRAMRNIAKRREDDARAIYAPLVGLDG